MSGRWRRRWIGGGGRLGSTLRTIDAEIQQFAYDYVTQDVMPCLTPSPIDLGRYRDVVLERFSNPFIQDTNQRVAADKKIHMRVPLHFKNAEISPGVKVAGGQVQHVMNELEISCLPKDLPEFIEVDLAELQAGHSLHLSALKLPAGVDPIVPKDEDPTVATIIIPRVMTADEEAAEIAAAAPTAADVPTTAQKAKEEEAAGGGSSAGSKPTVKDDKKNMKEAKK